MSKENYYLGKIDGENFWLTKPSWDCDWYWGFGYIGNKNLHTHWNSTLRESKVNHWNELPNVESKLTNEQSWLLAELMNSFYILKESAELFGRGGSHIASNPLKKVLTKKRYVDNINKVLLPQIFEEIDKLFKEVEG